MIQTSPRIHGLVRRRSGRGARWAHPLLVLAAFNLDFLCIHPFRDGNSRGSRRLLFIFKTAYREFKSRLAAEKSPRRAKTGLIEHKERFLGRRDLVRREGGSSPIM